MLNTISWNLRMSVRDGGLNDARDLMGEMVASTEKEPGAQGFEWFLSADGKICHLNERYADSEAAMVHLGNFGSKFADRFLACFEPTSLSVCGDTGTVYMLSKTGRSQKGVSSSNLPRSAT